MVFIKFDELPKQHRKNKVQNALRRLNNIKDKTVHVPTLPVRGHEVRTYTLSATQEGEPPCCRHELAIITGIRDDEDEPYTLTDAHNPDQLAQASLPALVNRTADSAECTHEENLLLNKYFKRIDDSSPPGKPPATLHGGVTQVCRQDGTTNITARYDNLTEETLPMPRFLEMAIMEDDPLKKQKLKMMKEGFSRGRPQRRTAAKRRSRRRRARVNPFSRSAQLPARSRPTTPRDAGPLDEPEARRVGDDMLAQDIGKREAQAEIAAGTGVTNRVTRSIRLARTNAPTGHSRQTQAATNNEKSGTFNDSTPTPSDASPSESEDEHQPPITPPTRRQSTITRARKARTGRTATNNDRTTDKRTSQKIWLWNWNRERLFNTQSTITAPRGTRQPEGGGPGLPVGVVGDHFG